MIREEGLLARMDRAHYCLGDATGNIVCGPGPATLQSADLSYGCEGEPRMAEEFYFNPFDPAFRANPYPFYKPLYAGPPRLVDFYGPTLLVARHADVAAVWSDA